MDAKERERLEALLEPAGWEPPPTLTARQVLLLAAHPELSGAEVLDEQDRL